MKHKRVQLTESGEYIADQDLEPGDFVFISDGKNQIVNQSPVDIAARCIEENEIIEISTTENTKDVLRFGTATGFEMLRDSIQIR